MISFIVPAHNEEVWIARSLSAIRDAMASVGEPYEVIVVDDSSTDSTASIAQQQGACVIRVEHRHISATRNSGVRQARGDVIFFVDADTLVNAPVIQSALRGIRAGAVGGGCVLRFEGRLSIFWGLSNLTIPLWYHLLRITGGACQFCTRDAFNATGGFSEKHYVAEDALFCTTLKRHGRFIIPRGTVLTSGRSLRAHSFSKIAWVLIRLAIYGPDAFQSRENLDMWYRPKREKSQ
jgi:glycosyltransferase involved in cell wall biosynthesis